MTKEDMTEIAQVPDALRLADYWERRAQDLQTWVDENDYVEFGYRPEGLKREQAGQREVAAELRRLHAEIEALKAAQHDCGFGAGCCYQAAKSEADEALLRHALDCLTYTAPRHDCIDAAAEYERMSEATITALKERLK